MKRIIAVTIISFLILQHSFAQTGCFEIESILVDACGTPEGENEMVGFRVGTTPLNLSSLTVDWPNGSWQGVCANAQSASIIAALNSTIQSCGVILEPPGGILPANAKTIIVTSTDMNPAANSFAGLSDTLYMIFQCAGNTAGHFKNYASGSGTRTLIMSFSGCSDTATYVVDSLVDQNGAHSAQDGATAYFDVNGNATYTNEGCQAPIIPLNISISSIAPQLCAGDTLSLSALISGPYSGLLWFGGTGTFSSQSVATNYISSSSAQGNELLYLGVIATCGDTVFDTLIVNYQTGASAAIIPSGSTSICVGDSVVLTASGGTQYLWSTGQTTTAIVVYSTGNYILTASSGCGIDSASINIVTTQTSNAVINGASFLCNGDSTILIASGGSQYLWSTGETTSSIIIYTGGLYAVTVSGCGSDTALVQVSLLSLPSISILASGPTNFCQGGSVILLAQGSTNYLWSTGATTDSITVHAGGSYTVSSSNGCGSTISTQSVTVNPIPVVNITSGDTVVICNASSLLLSTSGQGSLLWSTGDTTINIEVISAGLYTVTASNICGRDIDSIFVIVDSVQAFATADPVSGNTPLEVNFTNQSVNADHYQWLFETGNLSSVDNPAYTFTTEGSHQIQLIAYSTFGCADTFYLTIETLSDHSIDIPNIFTPNNDGMNDTFNIQGAAIQSINGSIYNRWGESVSDFTFSKGWDGKGKNDKTSAEGVYFYIVKITLLTGEKIARSGTVTLLR